MIFLPMRFGIAAAKFIVSWKTKQKSAQG